ncbi:MAG: alanyl-tRNA editing protein [Pseudomonadota bacterium]
MTTEALHKSDPYLTSCSARVLSAGPEGIVLDRTVFYPTGGGQPGDPGVLRWAGGETPIATATKGEDGAILHLPAEGAPLPPAGAEVEAEIDAAFRDGCRRVHTALHLLSVAIPFPVSGGSIAPAKGRLDFDMPEPPGDKEALAAALNALVEADHAVSETWITDEELAANPGLVKTMSVAPPTGQGRVRLVRIGEEAEPVDLQPCGGTHVRSTAEIGRVRIGKVEKKGARNRRVYLHLDA